MKTKKITKIIKKKSKKCSPKTKILLLKIAKILKNK